MIATSYELFVVPCEDGWNRIPANKRLHTRNNRSLRLVMVVPEFLLVGLNRAMCNVHE
jgi:hypothetical protein